MVPCFLLFFPALVGLAIAAVLFVGAMQRVLDRCAPHNRDFAPGMVWLLLVPVVNVYWWFRTVHAVGRSLDLEFAERGLARDNAFEIPVGIVAGATAVAAPLGWGAAMYFEQRWFAAIGLALSLAAIVLWLVYWVTITNSLHRLRDDDHRRLDFDNDDRDDDAPPRRRDGAGRIDDRYH